MRGYRPPAVGAATLLSAIIKEVLGRSESGLLEEAVKAPAEVETGGDI